MQLRQAQDQETELQKAQRLAADQQATEKAQQRAGAETERLFRLFGARSAYGMSSPLGFSAK